MHALNFKTFSSEWEMSWTNCYLFVYLAFLRGRQGPGPYGEENCFDCGLPFGCERDVDVGP